jgi:DNA invertase Pin-like site-specific DNA recombinase
VVAAFASTFSFSYIDRLGRSLQHLVETVNELHPVGVDLYVHRQAIDTSTPADKLAFSVLGALAEYERELIRESSESGLDRARRNGIRLGRPTNLNEAVRATIVGLRSKNPRSALSRHSSGGYGTVYKVLEASN